MSPILEFVAPRLLGPALMVAIALIVKGYVEVGDGFSAGVIVALAVALRYVELGPDRAESTMPVLRRAPVVAVVGLLIAVASGFFPILYGEPPFSHLPGPGEPVVKIGRLELITPVLFDVGIFVLCAGALVMMVRYLAWLVAGWEEDS